MTGAALAKEELQWAVAALVVAAILQRKDVAADVVNIYISDESSR